MLAQMRRIGSGLFNRGLVSSHSGNLSIRFGERLSITRRSCMLGDISEHDVVDTGIIENDRATPLASTELAVHRLIYQETPALAVVHAHPPHAVALSFVEKEIIPCDVEGSFLLERTPILEKGPGMGTEELARFIATELKRHRVVLIRSHGSFAAGQLLEEAYHYSTALEESCHILYLLKTLGVTPPEPGHTE